MAGFSKYLALAIFNMALNPIRSAFTPPAVLYLSLHTAQPSDATYGTEITYLSYARQPVNSLTATLAAEVAGEVAVNVTNGSAFIFPNSTDPADFTATHWAIWDSQAVGSGNILFSGPISSPRVISNGSGLVIPQGSLALTLT